MSGKAQANLAVDRDLYAALAAYCRGYKISMSRGLEIAMYVITQTEAVRGEAYGRISEAVRAIADGENGASEPASRPAGRKPPRRPAEQLDEISTAAEHAAEEQKRRKREHG